MPVYTCTLCGNKQAVRPDGRGFPPDIAKRKLQKQCKAKGCPCEPQYRAGFAIGRAVTGQSGEEHA